MMDEKLKGWLTNLPDFYKTRELFNKLGELDYEIILLKRQIEEIEEQVIITMDKPRSNETRIARIVRTQELKNKLAQLEADRVKLSWLWEFMKLTKDISYNLNTLRYLHKTGAYGEV